MDSGLCYTNLHLRQGHTSQKSPTSLFKSSKLRRNHTDSLLHAALDGSRTANAWLPATTTTAASIYNDAAWSAANHEPAAYDEPAFYEPAYDEPAYDEPSYDEPTYGEPTYYEPAYDELTSAGPAYGG